MDSEYLKANIGSALTEAMAALAIEQPDDAVEFLGTYLLSYVKNKESEASKAAALFTYEVLQSELAVKNAAASALQVEKDAIASALKNEENVIEESLTIPTTDIQGCALNLIQTRTNASGVYFGRKELNIDGTSQIQYTASTQPFVVGKVLKGLAEGEEEGAEGATWPIFESSEVEESTPNEEEGEEDEIITKTVFPEELFVPNVVRDENIKCFGLPKLGSYLAVPVRFDSCLWDGGMGEAPPPPEVEVKEEDADVEEGEEGEGEAEAKEAVAAADEAPVVVVEVEKYAPVYETRECIIGLDTIGTGREFTSDQKAFAKQWALKVASASAAAELVKWRADIPLSEGLLAAESALAEDINAASEGVAETVATKVGELAEEVGEEDKAMKESGFKVDETYIVAAKGQLCISSIAGLNTPLKPEALKVLAAALRLVKETYMDELNGKNDWELIRRNIGDGVSLFEKMKTFDVSSVQSEELETIKGDLEGLESAGISCNFILPVSSAIGAVLTWCNAAIGAVEAYAVFKEKEAELAAEAAVAAEEARLEGEEAERAAKEAEEEEEEEDE